MLLESLTISNYGAYAGTSTFDLLSTPERPIVLIGGLNGAGKTTILECIMIALYGKTYLGKRVTNKEYSRFMVDKMHRSDGRRTKSASVEISFRFYHDGNEDRYTVARNWTAEGASVAESFLVHRNGMPMADIDESQWQAFVEGLIPPGIARLFFFDGEKIVHMARWDGHRNDEMGSSLDTLLGAELIGRLHSDLSLYIVRKSGGSGESDAIGHEYYRLGREKESLLDEVDALSAEFTKKEGEIEAMASKIHSKESSVSGIGGGYAEIREDLLTQRATLGEKIRHQTKTIQEGLSSDAPLHLVPNLLERIRGQIEADIQIMQQKASARMVRTKLPQIRQYMESATFWPSSTDVQSASAEVTERLEDMFGPPSAEAVFDLASNEADWITQKIDGVRTGCSTLLEKIKEYEEAAERLENVEAELAKIPNDDEIGPRISEINAMHEEMGVLRAELAHVTQTMSAKRAYMRILQNKIKSVINSMHKSQAVERGMRLAARMQDVLDDYASSIRERKMAELESNLLDTARLLLHKDTIARIEIDRDTLEIKTFDQSGSIIPGGLLSMGERQIVGTALLWAIARTSGRSLPFVIDTPLGRLDGKHLDNLIERFYPFASHQLILLSTDREIGLREYKRLSEYISKSYRITCDGAKSVTTIADGYFTNQEAGSVT